MIRDLNALIAEMTVEEKASLCSGMNRWKTESLDGLGIPSMIVSDGPHGVRNPNREDDFGMHDVTDNRPSTCYPTASALASSWDRKLMFEVGEALAKEAKVLDIQILLGPGVNMKRSPLGGRNFEYFSEDPYLAGELGTAYVKGLQNQGVGASVKHYACNNQEHERMSISAEVDERALREIYLPAFEKIVKEAKPWSIMAAYNKVNGQFATENPYLLREILKDEWGYEGIVLSDWGATSDRVNALSAGLDLEMPGPSPANDKRIVEAVKSGQLDEQVLDDAVRRILRILFQALGRRDTGSAVDYEAHHLLAKKAAVSSIVLLKNEDNLLPLDANGTSSVAVIGQMAVQPRFQGGGSSKVNATQIDIPFDHILSHAGETVGVVYAQGYSLEDELMSQTLLEGAVRAAKGSEAVVLFLGLPDKMESEGYDRAHIDLPDDQVTLLREVANVNDKIIVVLSNGSATSMSWIDDAKAVLEGWLSGQASGSAIADILFGKANPAGKLQETFACQVEDNPSYLNFPGEEGKVEYREGIFVGYRYYDKKNMPVLFPFGHGLSYTSFDYANLRLSGDTVKDMDGLIVEADITNIGTMEGAEIVQLYVMNAKAKLIRPEKELKGFEKVNLRPGETTTIRIRLEKRDFSYYDPTRKKWVMETGKFEVCLGKSSRDICLRQAVTVVSTDKLEITLTGDSLVKDWVTSIHGKRTLFAILSEENMKEQIENALQGDHAEMVLGMPMRKMFYFDPNRAERADQIIERLLIRLKEES
ncbi:glycosyl hydrolase family 3 [Paenibacillus sp. FSL P4-0081]|uniref:beta-glucosidase family protein n=1 Tax=unclassified Paenibacillus TaxID=185978 RepID=UPI0004F76A2C|nr:glycoside hydrolase family 3 C-terminal domain-containing protein [Paenibacillus sp. FSL P4-0081]AIQ31519.1 glycosyl hydrolase family 3 [Paenibacillus sp. FSL P4-0081]